MSIEIRNYQSSDIYRLYDICLLTGNNGQDATGTIDPELLGHIFAAPYAMADPDLCFILTENGWPSGYILGTADSHGFNIWLETNWWPQLRQKYKANPHQDPRTRALIKSIHDQRILNPPYFEDYPAHLHIDLVANVQGAGHGANLMQTFLNTLQDRSVPGVHLGVSRANERATRWYPKFGFSVVHEDDTGIVFGLKL